MGAFFEAASLVEEPVDLVEIFLDFRVIVCPDFFMIGNEISPNSK